MDLSIENLRNATDYSMEIDRFAGEFDGDVQDFLQDNVLDEVRIIPSVFFLIFRLKNYIGFRPVRENDSLKTANFSLESHFWYFLR
jgi:hypothetical protein